MESYCLYPSEVCLFHSTLCFGDLCWCTCACVLSCWVESNSCGPMDWSPPASSVHGIFQARILEWVAISSSRGSSWPRDQTRVSYVPCIGRQILYQWATWWNPLVYIILVNSFLPLYSIPLHEKYHSIFPFQWGLFPSCLFFFITNNAVVNTLVIVSLNTDARVSHGYKFRNEITRA